MSYRNILLSTGRVSNSLFNLIAPLLNISTRNCAPAGGTCCGQQVCLVGEKCCPGFHCAPMAASCCGDGYCDSGKQCCGNGLGCAQEGYFCCEGLRQSCKRGDKCCEDKDGPYCSKQCLPTLKFPHIEGITDEVGPISPL